MKDKIWEILVPTQFNNGKKISTQYHQKWDQKIRDISGGLTIFTPAKGQWLGSRGKLFKEKMIPVRIICSKKEINTIITMTLEYYRQEAVLAYAVGSDIIIRES
ncbi:MAG TPA: hypothetical protein VJI98_00630 [Candidatus Nanoarchaeia archaeon]|nr:hypothetical protein [Candidatus Nanoarchaeia archaeon]